jgi:multiple sugar transport system permease protein
MNGFKDMDAFFNKTRKLIMGSKDRKGWLPLIVQYIILFSFGYIYLMPVFRMIVTSFMTFQDQIDPKIVWIPTQLVWENISTAYQSLSYLDGLYVSFMLSVVPALLQTACTCITGYALARFKFPLRNFWLILIIAFYLMPGQVLNLPRYLMLLDYGIIGRLPSIYLPAIFGQGLRNGIFILIFYQFFQSYPKSFDEAAEIDGAGRFKVFFRIALPMSGPALVISTIFSVVWYWNETSNASMLFSTALTMRPNLFGIPIQSMRPLTLRLLNYQAHLQGMFEGGGATGAAATNFTEGYLLAGTMLVILPMILFFLVMQRQFVESVERSGITGE